MPASAPIIAPEVVAALVAALVSLIGLVISYLATQQQLATQRDLQRREQIAAEQRLHAELEAKRQEWQSALDAQERQWQESFRAELRQNLLQESTLELMRTRLKLYGEVWRTLRITSKHEWRNLSSPDESVRQLAEQLTVFAYSEMGLVMSDLARRLLNNLRAGCSAYLRGEITGDELIYRAHMLKHALRSDLGIVDYEYDSDLLLIANQLGRIDDWVRSAQEGSGMVKSGS